MAEDDPGDLGSVADEGTNELYALDPADFVAGRTALVRRLRGEKRRELAAEVAKLRRPTPAAWAVNQLVRGRRAEVDALLALGDDLRAAQQQVLAGADAAVLRQAAKARRDAVAALTGAAAGLLARRGAGVDAHLPAVTATLEAASLDPELGASVLAGRLSTESEPPSGFGGLDVDLADLRPAAPEPAPAPEPEPDRGESRRAAAVRDAERELATAAERSRELAEAARSAAKRAQRAAQAATDARAEVARLRRRLEDAERDLVIAEEQAGEAHRRAAEAEAAAKEAASQVRDAEEHVGQARP